MKFSSRLLPVLIIIVIGITSSRTIADFRNATTITREDINAANIVVIGYVSFPAEEQDLEAKVVNQLANNRRTQVHLNPLLMLGVDSKKEELIVSLSKDSIDFNSSLLGLAVLKTKLPVLVLLTRENENYTLSSLASWMIWPFSNTQTASSAYQLLEGELKELNWPYLRKNIVSLLREPLVKNKPLNSEREIQITNTFEQLFIFQAAIIQNALKISNASFLMQRFEDAINKNPNEIPVITIEIARNPNISTLAAALSLFNQPEFNLAQKDLIQFMVTRIIASLPDNELGEAFALIRASVYPDMIIQEFFAKLSNCPKALSVAQYIIVFFESKADLTKYLILSCLNRLQIPGAPKLPPLIVFKKSPNETLQEWTIFLQKLDQKSLERSSSE